ncbi:MAG: 2-phosphosulfolactate phosphatase [Verrucomicrobiota bacterium]|jgi:2-phosphosulfolactate phosphatase
MKIETILTPAELPALAQRDLRATACVVFDVLRATSTFVTALHHGAKAIIPVSEIAEALAIRQKQPDVLLGGERNGVKIRAAQKWDRHLAYPEQAGSLSHDHSEIDFDLGNSPREYTPEKVRGKTIVSTTTNGTRALRACAGAQTILAASFLNLIASANFICQIQPEQVLIVCAGTRENKADEDVLAAGALCELLGWWGETTGEPKKKQNLQRSGSRGRSPHQKEIFEFSDSAEIARRDYARAKSDLLAAVSKSENARRLLAIPELRDDVTFCLQRDIYPLVAKMGTDGSLYCSY